MDQLEACARALALWRAKNIVHLAVPSALETYVEKNWKALVPEVEVVLALQAEAQAPTTDASVLTDIGATVKVGSDGRWLCLQGIGQHAMLNLESLEVDSVHGPIVREAINGFLKNLADRLTVGAPAPAKPNGPLHSPVDFTMSKECEADIKQIQRDMIAGSAAAAHIVVGAPAPAPTKFVAVNSAQDIDDVIADIMKPAKGYTP